MARGSVDGGCEDACSGTCLIIDAWPLWSNSSGDCDLEI